MVQFHFSISKQQLHAMNISFEHKTFFEGSNVKIESKFFVQHITCVNVKRMQAISQYPGIKID